MKRIWITMLAATMAITLCTTTAVANNLPAQTEQTASTTAAITQGTFSDFFFDGYLAQAVARQFGKSVNDIITIEQLETLKTLHLGYDLNITSLDGIGILSGLETFSFHNIPVRSIPDEIKNLKNLKSLSFGNNKITKIPDALVELEKLERLCISSNLITSLPNDISKLLNLQSLELYDLPITQLPTSIIDLSKLNYILIISCPIVELPNEPLNFQNLEKLIISDTDIQSIPDSIVQIYSLKNLEVHNNKNLRNIPENIGDLSNLEILSLHNNNISEIPNTISKLTKVKALALNENNLTTIPDDIGNMESLIALDLYDNKINYIPESIGNLKKLNHLRLDRNRFRKLPDGITNLTNLERFECYSVGLTELPENIGNLSNLRTFNLQCNSLTTVPESFGNLTNLESTALFQNSITHLPDSFANLKETNISIFGNRLQALPDGMAHLIKDSYFNNHYFVSLQNNTSGKYSLDISKDSSMQDIVPKLFLQLNDAYNFYSGNVEGTFEIKFNNDIKKISIKDLLSPAFSIKNMFSENGIYKIVLDVPRTEWNTPYILHYEYTIDVTGNQIKSEKQHNITVITRYLDGALPDETKTYIIADGGAFSENFTVLDGYELYNSKLRSQPVFNVNMDTKIVSLDVVNQDYTIELEFDKMDYKVTVSTEFPDGKHSNTSNKYFEKHDNTFQQTIAIPDGYTVTNLDQLPADVKVDLINKTITIPNIKKDYDIKLILEKQEYQATVQVVYSDDETKNTTDTYTVAHGDSLTTPFTYDTENYRIKNITFDASGVSVNRSNQVITIDSVTGNIIVTIILR